MTNYISPSIKTEVRFSQYVAELLVARKAQQSSVTLPVRYWNNPDYLVWTKEFKKQLLGVNKLSKIYNETVILKTLLQNSWVYSAHSPKLADLIREEQRKYDLQIPIEVDIIKTTNKIPPKKFGTKSKLSKLDE